MYVFNLASQNPACVTGHNTAAYSSRFVLSNHGYFSSSACRRNTHFGTKQAKIGTIRFDTIKSHPRYSLYKLPPSLPVKVCSFCVLQMYYQYGSSKCYVLLAFIYFSDTFISSYPNIFLFRLYSPSKCKPNL